MPLAPEGYARPRPRRGTDSKFYSPHGTFVNEARLLLRNGLKVGGGKKRTGDIGVEVLVFSDRFTVEFHSVYGVTRPAGVKADLDNYLKAILDAGNKTLWNDDRQIVKASIQFGGSDG